MKPSRRPNRKNEGPELATVDLQKARAGVLKRSGQSVGHGLAVFFAGKRRFVAVAYVEQQHIGDLTRRQGLVAEYGGRIRVPAPTPLLGERSMPLEQATITFGQGSEDIEENFGGIRGLRARHKESGEILVYNPCESPGRGLCGRRRALPPRWSDSRAARSAPPKRGLGRKPDSPRADALGDDAFDAFEVSRRAGDRQVSRLRDLEVEVGQTDVVIQHPAAAAKSRSAAEAKPRAASRWSPRCPANGMFCDTVKLSSLVPPEGVP